MNQTRLLFYLFPLLLATAPGDPPIAGKWRSPKPEKPGDSRFVHEYVFEANGHLKINLIEYNFDSALATWVPYNAQVLASGDNDNWKIQDGYLVFDITEKYTPLTDDALAFRLKGDSLWVTPTDVFHGKASTLQGEWLREKKDLTTPAESKTFLFNFLPNGEGKVTFNGDPDVFKYECRGDTLEFTDPADGILYLYKAVPKNLYLSRPAETFLLLRRKSDK